MRLRTSIASGVLFAVLFTAWVWATDGVSPAGAVATFVVMGGTFGVLWYARWPRTYARLTRRNR